MKTKTRIAITAFILCAIYTVTPIFGQTPDKYVQVGDTTINLADVDLEKGFCFPKKEKLITSPNRNKKSLILEKAIFKSPDNDYYSVVNDTSKFSAIDYEGTFSSHFQFFNSHGILIFDKYFHDASVSKCHITKEGKLIFIVIGSMEREEIHVYDNSGNLLRHENKYVSQLDASYQNKIITIKTENQQTGQFTVVFYINGVLQNKSLQFEKPGPVISFSSNEVIITIRHYDTYLLYNLKLELVKEVSFADYHIYVFNYGKHYKIKTRGINERYEIRDFITDEIITTKNTIKYNGKEKPIYFSGTVNRGSDFYYTAMFDEWLVFNFYDIEGNFINSDKTRNFRGMSEISFEKGMNGYKIIASHEK